MITTGRLFGRTFRALTSYAVYFALWAPLVAVVLYSFNATRHGSAWGGFTLEWYSAVARNETASRAMWTTLVLASTSAAIATVIGTLLGYAITRLRIRHPIVRGLLQAPMLVPDVVFAVALVLLFATLRRWTSLFELGLGAMVIGHVTFQIPFVALVVRARTAGIDPALEEAARDLGASPPQLFWHVTLPLLRPGIVAGGLLAFTLSLDDFAVSFFTGGAGSTTLPVLIYSSARRGITPDLHALSSLMLVASILAVVAVHVWNLRTGYAGSVSLEARAESRT